jgi:hypothetical protein
MGKNNKKSSGRAGHHGSSRSQGRKIREAWIENVKRGHKANLSGRNYDSGTSELIKGWIADGKAGLITKIPGTPTQDAVTPDTIMCFYQYAERGNGLTVLMVYDPNKVTDLSGVEKFVAEKDPCISNTYTSRIDNTLANTLPGVPPHLEGQYHVMIDGSGFLDLIGTKTQSPVLLDKISTSEAFLGMDLKHIMGRGKNELTAIIGEYFPLRR